MSMSSYKTYADEALISLLKKSSDQAFTEIYTRYWEKLLFIAGVKLRNFHLAEELVQDIFLDIWHRRFEIEIHGSLEAYLAVAMKYKVINAQVRIKRQADHKERIGWQLDEADNSTEQQLAFDELKERLSKHVARLPEKCRITYQLSKDHGLSHKEIARQLNISEKTVESHISRAIKSLRNSLTHFIGLF